MIILSDTPRTDAARGFFDMDTAVAAEEMEKIERELNTERAKVEQLRWAILSVMPSGPYDPILEPQWVYCAEALAATEEGTAP